METLENGPASLWAYQALELKGKKHSHQWSPQGQKLQWASSEYHYQVILPYAFQEIGPVYPPRVLGGPSVPRLEISQNLVGRLYVGIFHPEGLSRHVLQAFSRPKHHLPLGPFVHTRGTALW